MRILISDIYFEKTNSLLIWNKEKTESKTMTKEKKSDSKEKTNEGKYPFDIVGTFWGIRNSALTFEASLFELIDNSIGHGDAKDIAVEIKWLEKILKTDRDRLREVAVIDNGKGMNYDNLYNCLITGSSSTFNDRDSIGRFGFGLKAGGLNQCRRIEVYSKMKGEDTYYAKLDYDEFLEGSKTIEPPIKKEFPKEYAEIIKNSGTIVIWNKLDIAEPLNGKEDLSKLIYTTGRVYRKFIGNEILQTGKDGKSKPVKNPNIRKITINGKEVIPWDPLYYTKIPGFEKDERSEIMYDEVLTLPIHEAEELKKSDLKEDKIIIRMSLLPEKWRLERKTSAESDFAKEHHIDGENAGAISILRNGREVNHKKIIGIGPRKESEDRWWGMEIEYPATLDRWFSIKNVKVGLEPNNELKKIIDGKVKSTIFRLEEQIESTWKYSDSEKGKAEKERPTVEGHNPAEERFKETGLGRPRVFEELTEEEKDAYYEQISKRFSDFDNKVDKAKFEELNVKWFNDYEMPEKGPFIDINPKLGVTELIYNVKHVFFIKLGEITQQLEEIQKIEDPEELMEAKEDISKTVNQIRYCIDLLLGSFTSAYVSLDPYAKQEVKTTLYSLLQQWTTMLHIVADDPNFYKRVNG